MNYRGHLYLILELLGVNYCEHTYLSLGVKPSNRASTDRLLTENISMQCHELRLVLGVHSLGH